LGRPGGVLPGTSWLLPPSLGKKVAGVLGQGRGSKAGALTGTKGTTTVAPGVNAFVSPAITPGAGVTSDGSLGTGPVSYSGSEYMIPASVGTEVGGNLFESFSEFNLLQGEIADFQGPSTVQNILARVTGGSASSIDGTIQSDIQGANLFLINPSGVMFGPDASLNVTGAFTVSTADYVKLADGGKFNSSLGADDMLTAASVSAFGFSSATPAPVSFLGSQLSVPVDTGLNVIAGNVTLDSATGDTTTPGATLSAPAGELTIFSAAGAGDVPFSLAGPVPAYASATVTALGSLTLSNGSTLAINGGGGGGLSIRAGAVTLDDSTVSSLNYGSLVGGDIDVQSQGALSLVDGGRIQAGVESSGAGGDVSVKAGALLVDGDNGTRYSSILDDVQSGSGTGGNTVIIAAGITLSNGGDIEEDTESSGNAGNTTVDVRGSLAISGATALSRPGIYANADSGSTGNGGDLTLIASGRVTITAGGEISASTFSSGNGGTLIVRAGSLDIDGAADDTEFTGIATESNPGAKGNSGDLTLGVNGVIKVAGSGEISASTFSSGNAGDLTVNAGSLSMDGSATPNGVLTGILDESNIGSPGDSGGKGGNLRVVVRKSLTVKAGSQISTDTQTAGKAGKLRVKAGSISIIGEGARNTLISSDTSGSGKAGDVVVSAGDLLIAGGDYDTETEISAQSMKGATGAAGKVAVDAGRLLLRGGGDILTSTDDKKNAGDVTVRAGSLVIIGNPKYSTEIASDTASAGDAGDVTVLAGNILINAHNYNPAADIASDCLLGSTGKGGTITVHAGGIVLDASGQISSIAEGSGDAGDIDVTAGTISMNGEYSGFFCNSGDPSISKTVKGNGGNIHVHCDSLLITDGARIVSIAFSVGNAGSVTVDSDSLTIIGAEALFTGIAADGATGQGGNVSVNVRDTLVLLDGGDIEADADGSGNAGTVTVSAGSILINGHAYPNFTGISAEVESGATGAGGKVIVDAGDLVLEGGGEITTTTTDSKSAGDITVNVDSLSMFGESGQATSINSDTVAAGKAGDVNVSAQTIFMDGAPDEEFTGIAAESLKGAIGRGGDITVTAGSLSLENGAEINVATFSSARSGDVAVSAGNITISGGSDIVTGIFAASNLATGGGIAGGIDVQCDNLAINDGGEISTSAESAGAGDISINVRQNVTIEDQSLISASAGTSGGDITVDVGGLLYMLDGSITATAGADRSATGTAANLGAGNGGNITLDPEFIALNDSLISANAAIGQGGNIVLQSIYYLNSGSAITATGATSGTVTITSPELDLSGALVGLPSAPVGSETQLQETCAVAINGDFSSFLAVGQGDVEVAPDEAQGGTAEDRREHPGHRSPAHKSGIGL
jgi:filamentous hemagglutinin family protein